MTPSAKSIFIQEIIPALGQMAAYLPLSDSRRSGSIHRKLNVSQPVFAAMMNIPTVTAASWEHGRRKPTGAALRLLDIARKHLEVLLAG